MFKNLDIKTIFILILAGALILMFIFGGGNKDIKLYEDELEQLKQQNQTLLDSNFVLSVRNENLNVKFNGLADSIASIDSSLNNNSNSISDLEDEKDKISDNVRVLSADGVAGELSDYLDRRESKGSN